MAFQFCVRTPVWQQGLGLGLGLGLDPNLSTSSVVLDGQRVVASVKFARHIGLAADNHMRVLKRIVAGSGGSFPSLSAGGEVVVHEFAADAARDYAQAKTPEGKREMDAAREAFEVAALRSLRVPVPVADFGDFIKAPGGLTAWIVRVLKGVDPSFVLEGMR